MVGEIIDTYLHFDRDSKISVKKIIDSEKYELFTEENIFDKLNSIQKRQINNALITVSKQYNELFDIYGLCDKQNHNKLKVVLLSDKYKRINKFNGFIYRAGNEDESKNIIYINTAGILKESNKKCNGIGKEMERVLRHETIHILINDNIRNGKIKKVPELWIEEGLAESSNIINGTNDYSANSMDELLKTKYHFAVNLFEYLYLKNNKDNSIFKDMIKNGSVAKVIKEAGNKAGIKGGFKDIIKYWVKEKYGADDKTTENFLEDFKLYKRYKTW